MSQRAIVISPLQLRCQNENALPVATERAVVSTLGSPADLPAPAGLPRGFASPDLSGFALNEGGSSTIRLDMRVVMDR
jgi:hypothetical protein